MNGPVAEALAGSPALAEKYAAFRDIAHAALGEEMVAQIRAAVAEVHGVEAPAASGELPPATLRYAKRMPFEHNEITDEEAAEVVAELGEKRYVAFSVIVALADAECRAEKLDLPGLAASN